MQIAQVVIEHPVSSLDKPFDYYVPQSLKIIKGVRVEVEFNHQFLVGYVENAYNSDKTVDELEKENGFRLNPIIHIIDDIPLFTDELSQLAHDLAYQTVSPLISCFQAMLPPALKPTSGEKTKIKMVNTIEVIDSDSDGLTAKQKDALNYFINNPGIKKKDIKISATYVKTLKDKNRIEIVPVEVYRNPYKEDYPHIEGPELSNDQIKIINEFNNSKNDVFLLQGVTGSGKTEVYIFLTLQCLKEKKNVIILVPEISLTPLMVKRFKERINAGIAVFHSGLTSGEKYDEYRRIARGEVQVVIGARSAIFAPLSNIGLIVIDEEHSESYKQDSSPRYMALEVALARNRYHHSKLLLGSATPSLESKARAEKGIYTLLELPNRINEHAMPLVNIVDMSQEYKKNNFSIFSLQLQQDINACIAKHEQVIMLLNKRGYSPSLTCRKCNYTFKCPNCDVSLFYHRDINKLVCHYCGYEMNYPSRCPECGDIHLRSIGVGTQRVEEQIKKTFNAKVIRMDLDAVKNGYSPILDAFEKQEYDILLGTQMISKGLDFQNVTLVGVLNADIGLNSGDYRATERTFQLLTQVVGRSGRGDKIGKAVIQTFNPDNYAIVLASHHDYETFYKKEMEFRKERKYPPYRFLARIMFVGKDIDETYRYADYIKKYILEQKLPNVEVIGPAQPYITKVDGKNRMRLMMKYFDKDSAIKLLNSLKLLVGEQRKVEMTIDINPIQDI